MTRSSLMTRADVDRRLSDLRSWLDGVGDTQVTMSTLLVMLMEQKSPWADDCVLEVLRGDHGEELQEEALLTVVDGFGAEGRSYRRSFLLVCALHDRLELLSRVADMGMPSSVRPLDECGALATTSAGRWLDILASSDKRTFGGEGVRDFAVAIGDASVSNIAPALAYLLAKHDAQHGAIDRTAGTAHGLIMEALMRKQISSAATAEAAPLHTRHRRAAL